MPLYDPLSAHGVRDTPVEEARLRWTVIRAAEDLYRTWGYEPLQTPALERAETLQGQYGVDLERQIVRVPGAAQGQDEALRFDLTVPLARHVAQEYRSLAGALPLKRFQIGTVHRQHPHAHQTTVPGEAPGSRELVHADADIVGSPGTLCVAESIALAHAVLRRVGLASKQFRIHIGDRRLLRGVQARLGIVSERQYLTVLRTLNMLATKSEQEVRAALVERGGLTEPVVTELFGLLQLQGDTLKAQLAALRDNFGDSPSARNAIDDLEQLIAQAQTLGVPAAVLQVDPGTTRSADYYTGTVFKTMLAGLGEFGSVASGGRYSDMVAGFLGHVVPAVGLSIRVDRLADGLQRLGATTQARMAAPRVLVLAESVAMQPAAIAIARALREAGVPTDMTLDVDIPALEQVRRAERMRIPYVILPASAEAVPGTSLEEIEVTVRATANGQSGQITLAKAIDALAREDHGAASQSTEATASALNVPTGS